MGHSVLWAFGWPHQATGEFISSFIYFTFLLKHLMIFGFVWLYQATEAQPIEEPAPPTRRGRKRKALAAEPDLVGMVPEVVIVTNLEGGVNEEPLPNAELPEGWVPLEGVT